MGPILVLAMQASAVAAPGGSEPIARIDFDLARIAPPPPESLLCTPGEGPEIVVCGRRRGPSDRFTPEEMEELARLYAEGPPRAAIGLGGGAAGSFDFSPTPMPGGVVSNRMVVTVKLPF